MILVETKRFIFASHGPDQLRGMKKGMHFSKSPSNVYTCLICKFQSGDTQSMMNHFIEEHPASVEPIDRSINEILNR